MRNRSKVAFAWLALQCVHCGGTPAKAPNASSEPQRRVEPPSEAMPADCQVASHSDLEGAQLSFVPMSCTFSVAEAAAGVSFPYQLTVQNSVAGVVSPPSDDGDCGGKEVGGLQVRETVSGGEHRYCECDYGNCLPSEPEAFVLEAGHIDSAVFWPGVAWNGESDTMAPYGPAFPPGTYQVEVVAAGYRETAAGEVPFRISSTMQITLVP